MKNIIVEIKNFFYNLFHKKSKHYKIDIEKKIIPKEKEKVEPNIFKTGNKFYDKLRNEGDDHNIAMMKLNKVIKRRLANKIARKSRRINRLKRLYN